MDTKACTITEFEIRQLIYYHMNNCGDINLDETLDRLNYLNKRLKAFKEEKEEAKPEPVSEPAKTGW